MADFSPNLPPKTSELAPCDDLPIARFIADELDNDWVRAAWMTTLEYQAQLGLPLCTLDRAAELKAATVRACREQHRSNAALPGGLIA